jgi:hypothetical protein
VFHARTKYIKFNYHIVREKVTDGSIRIHFIFSQDELADALIKPLSSNHFIDLKFKLTTTSVFTALERAYHYKKHRRIHSCVYCVCIVGNY